MPNNDGLNAIQLPSGYTTHYIQNENLLATLLQPMLISLNVDESASFTFHLDAEWNRQRTLGVSVLILLAHEEKDIYIIPVMSFHFILDAPSHEL